MDCGKIVIHLYIVPLLPLQWYFFRGSGSKARVASQYHFNEKPHTITNDMVPHRVIMVIFVLLTTRSIQNTVPPVGWYILPPKWQK